MDRIDPSRLLDLLEPNLSLKVQVHIGTRDLGGF